MNILDFQAPDFNEATWLEEVFEKQLGVMKKYADIEGMPEWPMNVNTREGQKWFKDFLWRTTEEIAESYEAYLDGHETHTIEELADALHFFTELLILAGFDAAWARTQLSRIELSTWTPETDVDQAYLKAHFWLGMVGNTLKNKPWKQTEMLTDEKKFEQMLSNSFCALISAFYVHGANDNVIHSFYTRKNEVNKFRQRSNY